MQQEQIIQLQRQMLLKLQSDGFDIMQVIVRHGGLLRKIATKQLMLKK